MQLQFKNKKIKYNETSGIFLTTAPKNYIKPTCNALIIITMNTVKKI
jgi:hypothetical protein